MPLWLAEPHPALKNRMLESYLHQFYVDVERLKRRFPIMPYVGSQGLSNGSFGEESSSSSSSSSTSGCGDGWDVGTNPPCSTSRVFTVVASGFSGSCNGFNTAGFNGTWVLPWLSGSTWQVDVGSTRLILSLTNISANANVLRLQRVGPGVSFFYEIPACDMNCVGDSVFTFESESAACALVGSNVYPATITVTGA